MEESALHSVEEGMGRRRRWSGIKFCYIHTSVDYRVSENHPMSPMTCQLVCSCEDMYIHFVEAHTIFLVDTVVMVHI